MKKESVMRVYVWRFLRKKGFNKAAFSAEQNYKT